MSLKIEWPTKKVGEKELPTSSEHQMFLEIHKFRTTSDSHCLLETSYANHWATLFEKGKSPYKFRKLDVNDYNCTSKACDNCILSSDHYDELYKYSKQYKLNLILASK